MTPFRITPTRAPGMKRTLHTVRDSEGFPVGVFDSKREAQSFIRTVRQMDAKRA